MTETLEQIKAFVMGNKKLVAIAGGVLLLLIILIGSVSSGGSLSYKTAAVNYCEATIKELNPNKYLKSMNKKVLKAYLKDEEVSMYEFKKELKESCADAKELRKDFEIKASDYKIKKSGVTDYEDWDEDDVEELNDELREIGYRGRKVSKVREVTVEYECDGDEHETTVRLMKIGSKWYSWIS